MKLSIVIPVYGVENYVEDCIRSCIENIEACEAEVEMIIVDDGSKDHSMEIISKLVSGLSFVHVLTQQNEGLSIARNNGLKKSKGDYIWFVDSDDIIAGGVVDKILSTLDFYDNLDILELEYEEVDEFVDRNFLKSIGDFKNPGKLMKGWERFISGFNTPAQFHVFRRDFLIKNELYFYPKIYHEDCEFIPRTLWKAERVALLPGVAYYYRQRRNSIVSTPNPKKGCDYIKVAGLLHAFFEKQNMDHETRKIVSNYVSIIFCNGLNKAIGASNNNIGLIKQSIENNKCVLGSLKQSGRIKHQLLGYIGSAFPKHILNIYLFMFRFKKRTKSSQIFL